MRERLAVACDISSSGASRTCNELLPVVAGLQSVPSLLHNNNGRNGSCLTWLATSLEQKRRWLIINASPRGQCSK